MVRDTVSFLAGEGRRVFLDAEHFFDGYAADPAYALEVLRAAAEAGAEVLALCDTNGGMLPGQVADVVDAVGAAHGGRHGRTARHPLPQRHRLRGRQLARRGRRRRRARAGDAQRLRRAHRQRRPGRRRRQPPAQARPRGAAGTARLREATRIAHAVSEITNVPPYSRQPYVGASAFAHKAGLHASAIRVDPDLYQHTDPAEVGNDMRLLVSDMAGRASIELKGRELGFDLGGDAGAGATGGRPGQGAGAARLHLRRGGRVLRAAAARGGRRRPAGLLRRRVLAGDHRLQARGAGDVRGDGEARRGRPSGWSPPARATARSTRSTTPCGRRWRRPTRSWPRSS